MNGLTFLIIVLVSAWGGWLLRDLVARDDSKAMRDYYTQRSDKWDGTR